MAKDKKGFALLIAGKPTKGAADEEYEGEDVPTDEGAPEEEAAETPEYEASEYPEFEIPEGLDLSDLEEDDEKQVLAVVRKKSETSACIVSVDGVDLAGGEAEEAPAPPVEAPPMPPSGMGGPPGAGIAQRAMRGGLM
jgi:hypothetical protein